MRLRLGLLQDPAAIERQIQRELKEAERKRIANAAPTVKNEAETKAAEAAKSKERKEVEDHVKAAHKPPRIRPLSENKAIETGANFIAETFLFLVAGGLILAESWRRDRKEKKQDAEVADAIRVAESEREEMREKLELLQAEIEALMDEKKPFDEVRKKAVESLHKAKPIVQQASTASEIAAASTTGIQDSNDTSASNTTPPQGTSKKVASPPTTSAAPQIPPPLSTTSTSQAVTNKAVAQTSASDAPSSSPTSKGSANTPSGWLPASWTPGGKSEPNKGS